MSSRIRLQLNLWIKHQSRSPWSWLLVICTGAAVYYVATRVHTEREAVSAIYEQAGMLVTAVTMIASFQMDMDTGWFRILHSYPVHPGTYLAERAVIGFLTGLTVIFIMGLPLLRHIGWTGHIQVIIFMLPVYWTFGALAGAGTMLARHTVGGLSAVMICWTASVSRLGGEWSPVILHFPGVFAAALPSASSAGIGFDPWMITNRLFFGLMGCLLWFGSWRLLIKRNDIRT